MCQSILILDEMDNETSQLDSQGDFRALFGEEAPIAWDPQFGPTLRLDPNLCLCPFDQIETAKLNGYVATQDKDDSMLWLWRRNINFEGATP